VVRWSKNDKNVVAGLTDTETNTIYIDVGATRIIAQELHTSRMSELLGTIDHEYAHAFSPDLDSLIREETMARKFERAGTWARQEMR
jgi:hypothetical protein